MLFNLNSLKIVILGVVIGIITYFISPLLINVLQPKVGVELAYICDLGIIIVGDAIIYIGGLLLTKEKLTRSIVSRS